jgi:hypothetical protein
VQTSSFSDAINPIFGREHRVNISGIAGSRENIDDWLSESKLHALIGRLNGVSPLNQGIIALT